MTPTKATPSTGDANTKDELRDLEVKLQEKGESRARVEQDLKLQQNELQNLAQRVRTAQDEIEDIQKKIASNEQILQTAPQLVDALRKRKKIEAEMQGLKKELEFVERQAQDVQNRWYAEQNEHQTKENVLQNKRFMLTQMDQDANRGAYQSAQAEIHMLENDLARGQTGLQRSQEDTKRFDARLFDLQMMLKQIKQKQRESEQDEVTSRRLEVYGAENQRLKNDVNIKQSSLAKDEQDLKKVERSVKKLEERLRQEENDYASLQTQINQIKHAK